MARIVLLYALLALAACCLLFSSPVEVAEAARNPKRKVGRKRDPSRGPSGEQIVPPEMEYDADGNPTVANTRYTFEVPSLLHRVKQNDLIRLQKKFDVIAVFVGHPMFCASHCQDSFGVFKEVAKNFMADVGGHNGRLIGKNATEVFKFAFLDAEKEGDEYVDVLGGDHYLGSDFPQLLILKSEHQLVARKPPISFVLNDQLSFRLPKFLLRVAGESPVAVKTEEELMPRISHKATERVSIGFWMDKLPWAVKEIVFEQRFQFLFHHLPSPDKAELTLWQKYNPNKADIVMYFYKPTQFNMRRINESTTIDSVMMMDHISFNTTITGERRIKDHQHRLLSRILTVWGQYQPGREFERIRKITVQNSSNVPANCDDRRAVAGDRLVGQVIGRITHNGRPFLDSREDTFIVGDVARVDIPSYIMEHGFVGMCAGMKRRIGFPPNKAYPPELRPGHVGEKDRVTFHIHLMRFLDEGEAGPDNRRPDVEDTNDPEGEL